MDRRQFMQAAAVAGGMVASSRTLQALPPADPYLSRLGLQLWTVRNQMAEDAPGTLAQVAKAGYQQVELMEVLEADKLVPMAKDQGLAVTSGFFDWTILGMDEPTGKSTLQDVLDKATRHGLKHLVFGYLGKGHREKPAQLQRIAERCNKAAEACRRVGIQLCYHNHSFEFEPLEGGTPGFQIFMDEFDRELMKFELDVFWVACGGWNPVDTLQKLRGRVSQVHLKDIQAGTQTIFDESTVPADAFQELGDGTLDMLAILQAARDAGAEQCHVEQDQSPNPLLSIGQSIEFLRKA